MASFDQLMNEGKKDLANGRPSLAHKEFKDAMKANTESPEAAYLAAVAMYEWTQQSFAEALDEEGADLSELFPEDTSLGDALKKDSLEAARSASRENMNFLHYERARQKSIALLTDEGLKPLKRALELQPDNAEAKSLLDTYGQILGGTEVKSSGGCYIATACYGSYDHPDVLVLRRFRDEHLTATRCGRALIRLYYAVSPGLAVAVGKRHWLSSVVRRMLLEPMVDKLSRKDKGAG